MREPPYRTELKPYGRALVAAARRRGEILCLSGDLTRQTEVDLFQAEFPDRFIHGGMAEANMMSMAGVLARCGYLPFVHTFGVFATRLPSIRSPTPSPTRTCRCGSSVSCPACRRRAGLPTRRSTTSR